VLGQYDPCRAKAENKHCDDTDTLQILDEYGRGCSRNRGGRSPTASANGKVCREGLPFRSTTHRWAQPVSRAPRWAIGHATQGTRRSVAGTVARAHGRLHHGAVGAVLLLEVRHQQAATCDNTDACDTRHIVYRHNVQSTPIKTKVQSRHAAPTNAAGQVTFWSTERPMAHQSPAGQGTRVRVAPAGAPPTPPSSSPACGSRAEESTGVMGAVCSMTHTTHHRPILNH
jgi:hypothetical protein